MEQFAGWRDLESSIGHINSKLFPEFSVKAQLHLSLQVLNTLPRSGGSDGLYRPFYACFIEDNKENHALYSILFYNSARMLFFSISLYYCYYYLSLSEMKENNQGR